MAMKKIIKKHAASIVIEIVFVTLQIAKLCNERFACILGLWLLLVYMLLTRAARIDFMVIFAIVASGIIVFVPLYKKYIRK